ncbi:hypothetical protein ETAA8_70060 [Anatilimnocola aggregata]|uniref:DUF1549 domain-containing protein n=1 Tax=Anatilimnocola aggregata TaxID=2528021 RepID=A0A517YNP1_9BACT|nr:DUF1553 domain-containing protein [Anatilimnocola aggregata]QDU31845.1 hypothetical protein ETAA8_70060 [Anatilimnocola aggregata]
MKRIGLICLALVAMGSLTSLSAHAAGRVDELIAQANKTAGLKLPMQPLVDDPTFLRRIYVDMIGRIPTEAEVREFASWPVQTRREQLVDKLLKDSRFTDRWTVFYADMLRLRSNASGGNALIAYVHQAVEQGMPYDEMTRRMISINGKAGKIPEAGFVLSDNADPLAMASITSQVFMGIRIGCAQCHDHPFDVWTRKDFYDMAAYFGKTRRYESQLTNVVYSTEMEQTAILWPPEGEVPAKERKPLNPRFPFEVVSYAQKPEYITRLEKVRKAKADAILAARKGPSIDDLLAESSQNANQVASGRSGEGATTKEAKKDIRGIDIQASLYRKSEYREQLADAITDPRNRYFSRAFVNRVWKNLIGRGFVEPVDDFREDNEPVHPAAMDYLADEFVASDYDLRTLVRLVVTSDAYQRAHAPRDADELTRGEMETNLLATPMRRMIAEALFDSVVTAGHLFEVKHSAGKNEKTIVEKVRVPKGAKPGELVKASSLIAPAGGGAMAGMAGMSAPMAMAGGSYSLESGIEVDFGAVLKEAAKEEVEVESMQAMSREEIEAMRMQQERGGRMQYEEKTVTRVVDDNPVYNTSLRMQSPAPNGHFLQVFGQPNRSDLGDLREDNASMRQALMMLNGRLSHEAARVGDLEPMYKLVAGKSPDVEAAVKLAYLEILTRRPSAEEISEAKQIVADATSPLEGIADLRWVLINCNEFRFLP